MTTTKLITESLFELAKDDLKKAKGEKSMASRIGMIIQAMRGAISAADIYVYSGTPHIFNGKIYVPVDANQFKGCVFDVLVAAKMEAKDFTQIEKVQRISLQAVNAKQLQLRKDIIVFENGVLMLGDDKPFDEEDDPVKRRKRRPVLAPHSPELAQTTMCNFNYDPRAECPKWDTFLDNVLDNFQARMVLQEFLGCIYIDRRQHKFESMMILIGNGSNGKGVVSETVRGIVGYDSMTSFGLDSILSGAESLHNIAKMNGKRANWCTEIQAIQAGRFSDKLKTIISGEPIECRQMYGMPFTATEIPLMIANCNSLPPMQDKSYGMQRRFIIIRFDKTIPVSQQDKTLLTKLVPEYSGIFNWILEGRQRYIDQHMQFTKCTEIDEAVKNYLEAATNVQEWVMVAKYSPTPTDVIEVQPYSVAAKTLYDEYSRWCISESLTPYGPQQFGYQMTCMGFGRSRTGNGVLYKLYGPKAMLMLTRKKKNELSKQLTENGGIYNGQELSEGRVWDVGDASAAAQWHVSRPYLIMLRKSHYLDGVWKRDVRKVETTTKGKHPLEIIIYDHIKLGKRLEAIGVYDTGSDKDLSERRRDQIRRAKAFNDEMKKQGKPFRKLTGKGSRYPDNVIFVDPDWEYTPDSADALIAFRLKLDADRVKVNATKLTTTGKSSTRMKKKRLADAIADKIDGIEKENAGIDPETGEVLEIDLEDEDLKIV